jgi:hypothetical protein
MAGTGNTVERQCGTELTPLPAGTLLPVSTLVQKAAGFMGEFVVVDSGILFCSGLAASISASASCVLPAFTLRIVLRHVGKYLVVPTTTGIKLKESLLKERDPAATAQNAAAALVPLVRENDVGEMVFTGEISCYVVVWLLHRLVLVRVISILDTHCRVSVLRYPECWVTLCHYVC